MAERGAHTTSEIRNHTAPVNQPSIFDVLAQESLMSGLRPAARHLSKFLAWSYPHLFRGLARRFDEWYTLADFALQNYCLKHYSASFSENFYDMKRVLSSNGNNLPRTNRWRSLIVVVLIPYIRLKLDELHERLKKENERGQNRSKSSKWNQLKDAFLTVYPHVCAALEFWTLILQAGYILSKTTIHSPWLLLAGVRLEKLTPEDYTRMNVTTLHTLPSDASMWLRLMHVMRRLTSTLFRLFSKLLGIGLLLVQFLDYWQSSDRQKRGQSISTLPPPPAPHPALTEQNVINRMDPGLCPICRRPRQNDTVISVSGYVFCYICIAKYLQEHHCCPVTKLPAETDHLIRLYIQTRGTY